MTASRAAVSSIVVIEEIVGHELESDIATVLHELRHGHRVEYVHLDPADLDRSRLRVTSDAGVDYAIALPRDKRLVDGAVLLMNDSGAVVVRAGQPREMVLHATDAASALRLGFLAGHLHWKAAMVDATMTVTLEGPESDYRARIEDLLASGGVEQIPE
ncbi:urease accessory protein UreE [Rhodococcus sp. BP-252]|uniref:Urease accessory protein UreE n=1 Tax=Rhodococcoides kyotonense TaxID=398843 RepID=A0A177YNW4_9NOCA|nr:MULTISPECIES: urease accessory protein UreE [Rhodococcus]MBY6412017.1 urease accessory protein UreE [Rhodococcus sp. BP-320]MBY6416597.1 urease accessory protein UreE [Rhodococcus sp. BP-321]MBY6421214.1 urease accessory protein UreE [Rhodococcus sp. BP-324]MBY6426621.1 urease accessory protein UreE [Rhodococcus sp. BP-323]MBY6431620.1 urease accessory protein UreE [Rhodococcus sp. BP-322]